MDIEWIGPRIIKQGNQYLAVYKIESTNITEQLALSEILDDYLTSNIKRTHFPDENRTIYHYVKHINKQESIEYTKPEKTEKITKLTVKDLVDHLNFIHPPITLDQNISPIIRQRLEREHQWKNWFQEYQEKNKKNQQEKIDFLYQASKDPLQYTKHLLLDFQIEHVKILLQAIKTYHRILDASDTGTGKTYSALATARELDLIPIVICPKSIRPAWERVIKIFFPEKYNQSYVNNYEKYRTGNTKFLQKRSNQFSIQDHIQDPYIMNDQRKIPKIEFEWEVDPEKYILIFDECHKTKNTDTQNYAIYWWAHQIPNLKIISLSATVADKIENAYSITYQLGLINNPQEFHRSYIHPLPEQILRYFGYEVTRDHQFRLNHKYKSDRERFLDPYYHLKLLHHHFFPLRGSRMIIQDLGHAFPENFIQAQTYEMDSTNTKQIQETYHQLQQQLAQSKLQTLYNRQKALKDLRSKYPQSKQQSKPTLTPQPTLIPTPELQKLKELERNEQRDLDHIEKLERQLQTDQPKSDKIIDHLAAIMHARQKIELLKADTFIQLANDHLEKDNQSIAIFVNFLNTLDHLTNYFQKKKIKFSAVFGGQSTTERQTQIDNFQENKTRLILLTMGSGKESISLHDELGNHPRISLISPTWSAQDLIQALGRIHRAKGKTPCRQYIVFAADTIEEQICQAVSKKIDTINTINDGDLTNGLDLMIQEK